MILASVSELCNRARFLLPDLTALEESRCWILMAAWITVSTALQLIEYALLQPRYLIQTITTVSSAISICRVRMNFAEIMERSSLGWEAWCCLNFHKWCWAVTWLMLDTGLESWMGGKEPSRACNPVVKWFWHSHVLKLSIYINCLKTQSMWAWKWLSHDMLAMQTQDLSTISRTHIGRLDMVTWACNSSVEEKGIGEFN